MSGGRMIELLTGDCRDLLPTLPEQSVQTIVTSPPYFHLRRYTDDEREIGQEPTIAEYVAALVEVFMACWRVLRDDGTLWLNIGDAYANDTKWGGRSGGKNYTSAAGGCAGQRSRRNTGLPPKSLMGLPWRVAFALQDAGWILRNEIIWWKRNALPEGGAAVDRCARDHETVFLFSKHPRYYADMNSIADPIKVGYNGSSFVRGKTHDAKVALSAVGQKPREEKDTRHPRTVWDIPTAALSDEHYAPMPQALAERCIKAGSRAGDVVLDPFAGSGTTGRAALALGRGAILIDLAYQDLQARRTDKVQVRMDLSE